MPVNLVQFEGDEIKEIGVGHNGDEFVWSEKAIADPRLTVRAERIQSRIGQNRYQTEINLTAMGWLATLTNHLSKGMIMIIDYGYSFDEYYRSERSAGTLRCYFRHQASQNPLILPGLQDITSHVDFSSLAETALANNVDVLGYHEQADFLLAGDITLLANELQQRVAEDEWLQHAAALKQLILPGAMGHQFKVLSLSRGIEQLPRLEPADRRYQL